MRLAIKESILLSLCLLQHATATATAAAKPCLAMQYDAETGGATYIGGEEQADLNVQLAPADGTICLYADKPKLSKFSNENKNKALTMLTMHHCGNLHSQGELKNCNRKKLKEFAKNLTVDDLAGISPDKTVIVTCDNGTTIHSNMASNINIVTLPDDTRFLVNLTDLSRFNDEDRGEYYDSYTHADGTEYRFYEEMYITITLADGEVEAHLRDRNWKAGAYPSFELLADSLSSTALKSVDVSFITKLITDGDLSRVDISKVISNLGKEYIRDEHQADIFDAVQTRTISDPHFLQTLNKDLFSYMLSEDTCKVIYEEFLRHLGPLAKKLTQECVENIPNSVECTVAIRNWENSVISGKTDLHPSCYKNMSVDQVGSLGSKKVDGEVECKNVPLGDYLQYNGSKIKSPCYLDALKEASSAVALGRTYTFLPEDIFSAIDSDQASASDVIEKIDDADFEFISAPQKKPLMKSDDNCEKLPQTAFAYHGGIPISKTCFQDLEASKQGYALLNFVVPVDALDKVLEINEWSIGDEENKGFKLLNKLPNKEFIKNMCKDNCEQIDSVDLLKELDNIQEHASEECVKAMNLDEKHIVDLEALSARIIAIRVAANKELATELDDKIGDIGPKVLQELIKNHGFFKNIKIETFERLNKQAIRGLTAEQIAALPFLADLEESTVNKFSKREVIKMSAEDRAKIMGKMNAKRRKFIEENDRAAEEAAAADAEKEGGAEKEGDAEKGAEVAKEAEVEPEKAD